uniref:Uncharacterized protein n=1 Tax=Rangifer tarandus platyrhynchus TaxID=3082113 RepID=A0ACB0F5V4_RANTA|nr:unnamed protein product [Rangifer tarandus platyrhynchus]
MREWGGAGGEVHRPECGRAKGTQAALETCGEATSRGLRLRTDQRAQQENLPRKNHPRSRQDNLQGWERGFPISVADENETFQPPELGEEGGACRLRSLDSPACILNSQSGRARVGPPKAARGAGGVPPSTEGGGNAAPAAAAAGRAERRRVDSTRDRVGGSPGRRAGGFAGRAPGSCGNFPSLSPGRGPHAQAQTLQTALRAAGVPPRAPQPSPRAPRPRPLVRPACPEPGRGRVGPGATPRPPRLRCRPRTPPAGRDPPPAPPQGRAAGPGPGPRSPHLGGHGGRICPPPSARDGRLLSRAAAIGPRRPDESEGGGGGYGWAPARRRRRLRPGPESRLWATPAAAPLLQFLKLPGCAAPAPAGRASHLSRRARRGRRKRARCPRPARPPLPLSTPARSLRLGPRRRRPLSQSSGPRPPRAAGVGPDHGPPTHRPRPAWPPAVGTVDGSEGHVYEGAPAGGAESRAALQPVTATEVFRCGDTTGRVPLDGLESRTGSLSRVGVAVGPVVLGAK